MIVFLKKVRVKTTFSIFDPIKVEPLELSYLKTVSDSLGFTTYIIDDLFGIKPHAVIKREAHESSVIPHIIVLTGYNVSEKEIINEARLYKNKYPKVKIIVGGVHVQLNSTSFHKDEIDFVIHSPSLKTFEKVLKIIEGNIKIDSNNGFDYRDGNWVIGSKEIIYSEEDIKPDRELFNKIKNKTQYLDKRNIALIKGSIGCPYNCSYCYCRELNGGKYIKANYNKMIEEMSGIDADYFWIVDDVLFLDRSSALNFIDEVNKAKLQTKFIGYLRADFIIKEKDILPKLKESGLNEVIIGFEAINNEELEEYNKSTNAIDYPEVISVLKENQIDFTALFMVQPDYGIRDFVNLYRFIKKHKIEVFTLSILTPIKGTKGYIEEKGNLIRFNPKYFDFLHLVTKSRLPKIIFYFLFYIIHLRLLKSKRILRYITQ